MTINDVMNQALAMIAGAGATGFEQAPNKFQNPYDEKPRFEIDDSGAKMRDMPVGSYSKTLSELLDHPELFKQYPDLQNVKVMTPDQFKEEFGRDSIVGQYAQGAAYDENENVIIMPSKGSYTPTRWSPAYESAFLPHLLHETQHAIQTREGSPRGGGSQYMENAGEIEAFQTQGRAGMTPEQRVQTPPFQGEIPKAQAEIIFRPKKDFPYTPALPTPQEVFRDAQDNFFVDGKKIELEEFKKLKINAAFVPRGATVPLNKAI